MMTPKLLEMIQEALKVPAFKYGSAMGEALQFGWKPIGGAIKGGAGMAVTAGKLKAYEEITPRTGGEDAFIPKVMQMGGWGKHT